MKFKLFIGSHVAQVESQRELTHALIGQLDIETEKPTKLLEKLARFVAHESDAQKPTDEEIQIIDRFDKRRAKSAFEPKVLDWFTSEEAAEAAKSDWTDRINFNVRKVDVRIP